MALYSWMAAGLPELRPTDQAPEAERVGDGEAGIELGTAEPKAERTDIEEEEEEEEQAEEAEATANGWRDAPYLDLRDLTRLESIRATFSRKPDLWQAFLLHTGGTEGKAKPVAFRTIDWFVTNYCRGRGVVCGPNRKEVYMEYKMRLRCFHKEFFDPFCRGSKIRFHPEGDGRADAVSTALCQLNFFIWAIESGVAAECAAHVADIEQERKEANRAKRKRQVDALLLGCKYKRMRLVDARSPGLLAACTNVRVDWN